MRREFYRSPLVGYWTLLVVFFVFGYMNQGIMDYHVFNSFFEHEGKFHLFYETRNYFEAFPAPAVSHATSEDSLAWKKKGSLFTGNCVVAQSDNELVAFFNNNFSFYEMENLSSEDGRWLRAVDYPDVDGRLFPVAAFPGDETGMLAALMYEKTGQHGNSTVALKILGFDDYSSRAEGPYSAKLDLQVHPVGGRPPFGRPRVEAVRRDGEVIFFWLEEPPEETEDKREYYEETEKKDLGPRVAYSVFEPDSGFTSPSALNLHFREIAACEHDGRLLLAGVPLDSAGLPDLVVFEVSENASTGKFRSGEMVASVTHDFSYMLGREQVFDVGFGDTEDMLFLFCRIGADFFCKEIVTSGQTGLVPVVEMDRLRKYMVRGWIYLMLALTAGSPLIALFVFLSRRKRRLVWPEGMRLALAPPAPILNRGVAFVVDFIIVLTAFTGLIAVMGLVDLEKGLDMKFARTKAQMFQILIMAGFFVYNALTEAAFGRTPGKMIFNLDTRSVESPKLTPWQATLRNLFKLTPEFIFIDMMFMLFTRNGRRLGDLLSGTTVLARDFEEQEPVIEPD